jgi:hypothetical protein
LQVSVTTIALWRYLPPSGRPARAELGLLRNVWRFAAGMSGITITAIVTSGTGEHAGEPLEGANVTFRVSSPWKLRNPSWVF